MCENTFWQEIFTFAYIFTCRYIYCLIWYLCVKKIYHILYLLDLKLTFNIKMQLARKMFAKNKTGKFRLRLTVLFSSTTRRKWAVKRLQ